jgi:hypothetical protein
MAFNPAELDFSHLTPDQAAIERVNGQAPNETPIVALGISAQAAALLTPGAATLTKSDLMWLNIDTLHAAGKLGLNAQDLSSIQAAFTKPMQVNANRDLALSVTIVACCCPCCCAAAVPTSQAVR